MSKEQPKIRHIKKPPASWKGKGDMELIADDDGIHLLINKKSEFRRLRREAKEAGMTFDAYLTDFTKNLYAQALANKGALPALYKPASSPSGAVFSLENPD